MAKRPRHSRWRRLPGVYRFGEQKWPDPNQEPQRLTLYVTGEVLDHAEAQAVRLGFGNAQDYCTELVVQAIEDERVREKVADVEAERGPLEGLQQIADDPEYLAELTAASAAQPRPSPDPAAVPAPVPVPLSVRPRAPEIVYPDDPDAPAPTTAPGSLIPMPTTFGAPAAASAADALSPAAQVVLRHAAQGAVSDPRAFLPALRRGETVAPDEVAELAEALSALEAEYRGARAMDRRLSFALHRLAFESQILHTDAWPNAFDRWTVDTLRAIQEAVERILSGQDIRYYSAPSAPPRGPTPSGGFGSLPRPEATP